MSKKIEITELVLRDAHQSLLATRMALEDMLPACAAIDAAGYWSVECWGGATYDACIRFLNEDPWERLRTFRAAMPNSRLQMLLRGQNLLGYRHYEDAVVQKFVEKSAENGIDVFRVFDALNDVRNIEVALAAVKATGKHAEGTVCYTVSPAHTVQGFVEMAQKLKERGADSICIKDMAALLKPQAAYDLVKGIKQACGEDTLVHLHVHSTTGVTLVSIMKAIEAGCDIVDSAVSSLSLGPGHNPTESLVEMLEGTGFHAELDMEKVLEVRDHFAKVKPRYQKFLSNLTGVDTDIFQSQIPGGMLSNMESQLKQQGAGDRIKEVMAEVPRVRAAAGYPPLVTPSSQIVGTQAVFNVMMGAYQAVTAEFADLMLGYYGETISEKDPKVMEKALAKAGKPLIEGRPADLLEPEWDGLRTETLALEGAEDTEEDVLTYAMFPKVAPKFFSTRKDGPLNLSEEPGSTPAPAEHEAGKGKRYVVTYEGRRHDITVSPVS